MAFTRRQCLATLAALGASASSAPARARISLLAGRGHSRLPFSLIDHRLFVDAEVNGRGPWAMVFDSGGANILDLPVAERLGLPLRDRFEMPGAGDTTLPAWRTHVHQARLGEITMTDIGFVVMPLAAIRQAIGFARLDGLVGHELLQRFVVQMDFRERALHFHESHAAPAAAPDAVALPIDFSGTIPRIEALIDGRRGRLALDTGDRSALTLFAPFVEEHRLREAYRRTARHVTGWGVGGALLADVLRLPRLDLGAIELRQVLTRLPLSRSGVFASRLAAGSLGTAVLRHLNPVFDYSRGLVHLTHELRAKAPQPPQTLQPIGQPDRSGMWLRRPDEAAGAFEVQHVVPGGPAARAGLVRGDHITALDGRPTAVLLLPQVRERLASDPAGTPVRLQLRGGREVRIELAEPF